MSSLQTIQPAITTGVESALWYAVHTRSRHEKRVANELDHKGIATFLPTLEETRKWTDRRVKIQVPLFSCYLFVNIPLDMDARLAVLRTAGVLSFVGGNYLHCPVPSQQIRDIQTILNRAVPCSAHPFIEVGQRVRIRGGALDGIEGVLHRFGGNDRLVISVQTIQRSLSVTVEGCEIEILERSTTIH